MPSMTMHASTDEQRGETTMMTTLSETSTTSECATVHAVVADLPPEGATAKEMEAVTTLAAILKEEGVVPADAGEERLFMQVTLLRFIRARPTMAKSLAMFKEMIDWWRSCKPREQQVRYKAESTTTREGQIVKEYYPVGLHGTDKRGCPVLYGRYGVMELEAIVSEAGLDMVLARMLSDQFDMEEGNARASRAAGCAYPTNVVVIDMEGMSWRRAYRALPAFGKLVKVMDANFPERLETCLIVRAPRVFSMLYKLAAPLLSAETRAKIQIFGRNTNWLSHLTEHVDLAQIPSFLGGKSAEPWQHGCGGMPEPATVGK